MDIRTNRMSRAIRPRRRTSCTLYALGSLWRNTSGYRGVLPVKILEHVREVAGHGSVPARDPAVLGNGHDGPPEAG